MNMIKAKELRHRFVRRHILTDKFFVYDATLEAAKQIMAEFPEDTELVNHLHQKFQKWEEGELRQAENNKLQAAEVEKKRQALTQAVEAMKIKPS